MGKLDDRWVVEGGGGFFFINFFKLIFFFLGGAFFLIPSPPLSRCIEIASVVFIFGGLNFFFFSVLWTFIVFISPIHLQVTRPLLVLHIKKDL
jgi:hypothetical protein